MGASESSLTDGSSSNSSTKAAKLEDIPESCIALVLSYLDPPEIAKLARLNRAFRAASSADFIWVPKLPSTYPFILTKFPSFYEKGKMDIYARLCKPTPFDAGTKEVWIDKRTGGVCLAVSNKAMRITGIDDRRYWNQISTHESRFGGLKWRETLSSSFLRELTAYSSGCNLGKSAKEWDVECVILKMSMGGT